MAARSTSVTGAETPRYGTGGGKQPTPPSIAKYGSHSFVPRRRFPLPLIGGDRCPGRDWRDVVRLDGKEPLAELKRLYPNANVIQPGWILKVHLLAPAMAKRHAFANSAEARRAFSQLFPRDRLETDVLRGMGKGQNTVVPPVIATANRTTSPPSVGNPQESLQRTVKGRTIRIAYASSRVDDYIATMAGLSGVGGVTVAGLTRASTRFSAASRRSNRT